MKKKIDFLVVVLLISLAVLYSLYIPPTIFIGKSLICGMIFLLPSSIYLGMREPKNWKKILFSGFVFGLLFGFIFEFIAEYNQAYAVVSTISNFKILGVLHIDNIIGHMIMVIMTLVFYEHFIDIKTSKKISKNFLTALLPAIVVIVGIVILFLLNILPRVEYSYLIMGSLAIISPIYLAITKPHFIKNMSMIAIFFFFFYLIIEIVAVRNSWWIYPDATYLGWVHLLDLRFPLEEMLFWMFFYAATLVSYYELFIDIHPRDRG